MDTSAICQKCGGDNTRDNNLCGACEATVHRPYQKHHCRACNKPFLQATGEEPVDFCARCYLAVTAAQMARVEAAWDAYQLARLKAAVADVQMRRAA